IVTVQILATEVFRVFVWERECEDQYKTYRLGPYPIHRLVVRIYCFVGYFLMGISFNWLMVDIAKYTTGRHRPHFMDICRPSVGHTYCTNPTNYIIKYECTGTFERLVKDSQLSFYSGHAATSFFVACFTSLYLRARLYQPLLSRLLVPGIQFCLLLGASYVSLTRISDYMHHWSDVFTGVIMGSIIGIATALYIAEVFKRREVPPCLPTKQYKGLAI
ncbi:PAP2 family protein, partial [Oesophagostomum dentatum]